MNKDQFLGKWKEFKGKIKEKWGKLTDDDITQINGKWDQLSGRLQKKYGWTKEHAEREMNDWCSSCEHRGLRREEGNEEQASYGRDQSPWDRNEGQERTNREDWHQRSENEKKHPPKDEHKDKKRKAG